MAQTGTFSTLKPKMMSVYQKGMTEENRVWPTEPESKRSEDANSFGRVNIHDHFVLDYSGHIYVFVCRGDYMYQGLITYLESQAPFKCWDRRGHIQSLTQ